MTKTNIAKFIFISLLLAGFITASVLELNIPDLLKLTFSCFLGALMGIFMGWIGEE